MLCNSAGLRVRHIISHPGFQYGCQPAGASPTSPVLVGSINLRKLPDGFNGCHDVSRGHAPFQVVNIEFMDECDASDQLGGFAEFGIDWAPGRKIVTAVRLSPKPDFQVPSMGERIMFIIGPQSTDEEPVVESVMRVGRRTEHGQVSLCER